MFAGNLSSSVTWTADTAVLFASILKFPNSVRREAQDKARTSRGEQPCKRIVEGNFTFSAGLLTDTGDLTK